MARGSAGQSLLRHAADRFPAALDGKLTRSRGERGAAESSLSSACCRRNDEDVAATSTYGQHVAWVGTWDDLRHARPGLCRIKLLHSYAGDERFPNPSFVGDTGYSGVELLPGNELLCATYSKHWPDARKHSVVCTRLELSTFHATVLAMLRVS